MAITKFQPEIWSAQILSVLAKSLVYGGVVNRNYEGEISQYGDTVHIPTVADPNIFAYSKDNDLTAVQALTDDELLLAIDQSWAFNFQIDDIDKAQIRAAGALMTEAASRAAFGLRDKADLYLSKIMNIGASATNTLGLIDGTTATNVYDLLLVPASVKLDEANVPTEGRWIVLPPAVYGKLQLDGRFVKQNEAGTNALHNGVVGQAAGFTIYKSNNAPGGARTAITATTVSGAKSLTAGAAGTFFQSDVGMGVTGTGIGAACKVASVDATGTVATLDTNSTANATVADIAITGATVSKAVIYGTSAGASFAQQIAQVEAYRPEKRFGDALKGLHLFGGKVVRPTALGVASVKTA